MQLNATIGDQNLCQERNCSTRDPCGRSFKVNTLVVSSLQLLLLLLLLQLAVVVVVCIVVVVVVVVVEVVVVLVCRVAVPSPTPCSRRKLNRNTSGLKLATPPTVICCTNLTLQGLRCMWASRVCVCGEGGGGKTEREREREERERGNLRVYCLKREFFIYSI